MRKTPLYHVPKREKNEIGSKNEGAEENLNFFLKSYSTEKPFLTLSFNAKFKMAKNTKFGVALSIETVISKVGRPVPSSAILHRKGTSEKGGEREKVARWRMPFALSLLPSFLRPAIKSH